ncbi:hypothetical protein, partial [Acetobacter okinawensis]|uniref:hypothetical protein n=1 Tax=Acetobacter okinawensis TaxID=1076594 RepID=UPI0039E99D6B
VMSVLLYHNQPQASSASSAILKTRRKQGACPSRITFKKQKSRKTGYLFHKHVSFQNLTKPGSTNVCKTPKPVFSHSKREIKKQQTTLCSCPFLTNLTVAVKSGAY